MIGYIKRRLVRIQVAYHKAGGVIIYVYQRLGEPGTWKAMVPAIAAAGILPAPWSYVALVAGLFGLLIPDKVKPV